MEMQNIRTGADAVAALAPCCRVPENRFVIQHPTRPPVAWRVRIREFIERLTGRGPITHRPPVQIECCLVCNRRHYRLFVGERLEPGQVRVA